MEIDISKIFNSMGMVYIVLGDTYSIKDILKSAGAIYNSVLGWYFKEKPDGYLVMEINYALICLKVGEGWEFKKNAKEIIEEESIKVLGEPSSQYYGDIGDRIHKLMYYGGSRRMNMAYGLTWLHNFIDEDDNEFIWWTTKGIEKENGAEVYVDGVIKDFNEYKRHKQTVLTRCKIYDAN